jgi:hypothetical protein
MTKHHDGQCASFHHREPFCPQPRSSGVAVRFCLMILGGIFSDRTAMAQNVPPLSAERQKAEPGLRSRTFHLYQRSLVGGVGYGLDGTYVVRAREVVVTSEGGPLVAHRAVVLHSLRFGICGSSDDGYADNVFSAEIMLNEIRLAAGESYGLPARVIRIPLPKAPPEHNWLCSILSESGGSDVAEVPGRPIVIPSVATHLGTTDVWKRKKPADWSNQETQEFLTKSPWVHYFGGLQVRSDFSMGGQFPLVPVGSLAIRWESAPLVRDALMRIESKEYNDALARLSKDYYVIAVLRMPPRSAIHTGQTRLSGHWSPEQEEELRKARADRPPRRGLAGPPLAPIPVLIGNEQAERAFSVSRLSRPGYEAISPARVESGVKAGVSYMKITFTGGRVSDIDRNGLARQGGTVNLIMFPRSLALEDGSGDIEFSTVVYLGMGRTTFRAKFSLKDLAEAAPPPDTPIAATATPPVQPQSPPPVSLGQTIDQVVAILGPPESVVDLGSKKIYVY